MKKYIIILILIFIILNLSGCAVYLNQDNNNFYQFWYGFFDIIILVLICLLLYYLLYNILHLKIFYFIYTICLTILTVLGTGILIYTAYNLYNNILFMKILKTISSFLYTFDVNDIRAGLKTIYNNIFSYNYSIYVITLLAGAVFIIIYLIFKISQENTVQSETSKKKSHSLQVSIEQSAVGKENEDDKKDDEQGKQLKRPPQYIGCIFKTKLAFDNIPEYMKKFFKKFKSLVCKYSCCLIWYQNLYNDKVDGAHLFCLVIRKTNINKSELKNIRNKLDQYLSGFKDGLFEEIDFIKLSPGIMKKDPEGIINSYNKRLIKVHDYYNSLQSDKSVKKPKRENEPEQISKLGLNHEDESLIESMKFEDKFEKLINTGTDLNERDESGRTCLHHLCKEAGWIGGNHFYLIRLLVENGADINIQDNKGNTPLHYISSARGIIPSLIKYLIKHGARLDINNYKGQTPYEQAEERENHELRELFSEYI